MNLLTPYIIIAGAMFFVVSSLAMLGVKQLQKRLRV